MPQNLKSVAKANDIANSLSIQQAIESGTLADLNTAFSEYYKINMEILKLHAWKLLITKTAFQRYISTENNSLATLLKEDKSRRFCEILFYLYAELKKSHILATNETTFTFQMPISTPEANCAEAIEVDDPPHVQKMCVIKVLIRKETFHLIIALPNDTTTYN